MNNNQHHEMVKKAVQAKFRGNDTLTSKRVPLYPASVEREFQRVCRGYVRLLNKTMKKHLPHLMKAYIRERNNSVHTDDVHDLEKEANQEFQKIAQELEKALAAFDLKMLVDKISKMAKNAALREWKIIVHETLGIDLMDDYFEGDFYADALQRWVDENVLKIQRLPQDTLGDMKRIVLEGYRNGETVTTITKQIQNSYNVSKDYASFLARDQLSTLNAQITKFQQTDAGCTHYKWSDSGDSRVRSCHRFLNGKICSWDDPPEMWYETKKSGRVYTGRRCHPGEDYGCRCVAIPVFDLDKVDVPMKGTTPEKE